MTFPVFQAIGAFAESDAAAITVAWPAHQAGDVGFLITESNTWPYQVTDPAGFKELPCSPLRHGSSGNTENSTKSRVFWKRATGSAEPSPVVSFPGDHIRAVIVTFRGCAATGNPFTICDASGANAASTVTFPAVTTTTADQLILHIVTTGIDINSSNQISGYANSNLANIVERLDSHSTIGTGSGIGIATGEMAVAGAIGNTTATLVVTNTQARFTIALTAVDQTPDRHPWIVDITEPVESATVDVTVPWPAQHQADDIGILVVEGEGWPQTLATAAGFAEITDAVHPLNAGTSGTGVSLAVYWCRATSAAMASPVVDFISGHVRAMMFCVRGAKKTGSPVHGSKANAKTNTTIVIEGLTTTVDQCAILGVTVDGLDNSVGVSVAPTTTWVRGSNIENWAEHHDSHSVIGGGSGINVMYGRKPVAGAFGDTTNTPNTGTTLMRTVVIEPEAAQSFTPSVSGGAVLAGTAPLTIGRVFAPSGGLTAAGAAPHNRGVVAPVSGGAVFSGTAPITATTGLNLVTYAPTGGLSFAGVAAIVYTPAGGVPVFPPNATPAVGGMGYAEGAQRGERRRREETEEERIAREAREQAERERRERERIEAEQRRQESLALMRQAMEQQVLAAQRDLEQVVELLLLT